LQCNPAKRSRPARVSVRQR